MESEKARECHLHSHLVCQHLLGSTRGQAHAPCNQPLGRTKGCQRGKSPCIRGTSGLVTTSVTIHVTLSVTFSVTVAATVHCSTCCAARRKRGRAAEEDTAARGSRSRGASTRGALSPGLALRAGRYVHLTTQSMLEHWKSVLPRYYPFPTPFPPLPHHHTHTRLTLLAVVRRCGHSNPVFAHRTCPPLRS